MGGKTAQSTQQVAIPPDVLARYNSVNAQAQKVSQTPFQQYGGQFVAPVNSTQQTGIDQTEANANIAQPYYKQAAAETAAASAPISSADILKYANPFTSYVEGATANVLNQNNQQQQQGALGDAIRNGAFGGDRTGLAAANLEEQQNLANSQIYSGIASEGYGQGLSTALQEQQTGLAGAAQTAQIGTGAQEAALTGAQAEIGAGGVKQQTLQAGDTALYNQFLQQQSYPFQVEQFLANIAEGTGALSGSTTTTTQPGGFFSDERLKTDIEQVGKTFDGQPIYRDKYRGDPRTQIGLIAQKVEKKHPRAVGLAGGYKTVDYGDATEASAKRGHFALGGAMREGYAEGGSPFGNVSRMGTGPLLPGLGGVDYSALLQAQEQMYAPYAQSGLYGSGAAGSPYGGSGHVPPASLPVSHLTTAPGLNRSSDSVAQNMNQMADLAKKGADLYGLYKKAHPDVQQQHPWVQGSDPSTSTGVMAPDSSASTPDATQTLSDPTALGAATGQQYAKGGRIGLDTGGMPYVATNGQLDIPNVQPEEKLQTAPALQKPESGFSQLAGDAKDITAIANVASMFSAGGALGNARHGYADGGDPSGDLPDDNFTGGTDTPGSDTYDYLFNKRPSGMTGLGEGLASAATTPVGGLVPASKTNEDMGGQDFGFKPTASTAWNPPAKRTASKPPESAGLGAASLPSSAPTPAPTPAPTTASDPNHVIYGANGPEPVSGLAGASNVDLHPAVASGLTAGVPDGDKPGFMSWLKGGGWKSPEALSILSGIASMGTAPTKHLGVALASGIGTAAQSYLPM